MIFCLNLEILVVQATTYDAAMPIRFSLIDDTSLFKINPITGSIVLYNPITKQVVYSIMFRIN